jgi:glycerol-3-phosphate acyltransferase PlsY
MTNVTRAGGKGAGAITFVGDLLKGMIPVLVARTAGLPPAVVAVVGFGAFVGAICSIFLRFHGGKGVSASLGIWLGIAPAPVLIAVTAHTLTSKGEVNRCAPYDAGAAAMALVLQAHALGLAAHQMSGFDVNAFRKAFAIPDDVEVIAMISLGHYGDVDKLDPVLREREKSVRTRLPLGEVAYSGVWKKAF